jgi:hypothetical protein
MSWTSNLIKDALSNTQVSFDGICDWPKVVIRYVIVSELNLRPQALISKRRSLSLPDARENIRIR